MKKLLLSLIICLFATTLFAKEPIGISIIELIANSEKYIVCKEFRLLNSNSLVKKLSNVYDYFDKDIYIERFLNIDLTYLYINKIEEYNAIFGQQQIENINSTLNLINNNKSEKMELYKKNNILKCGQWCAKYNLPYNKNIQSLNIFIPEYLENE